jgi:hypothetical protein
MLRLRFGIVVAASLSFATPAAAEGALAVGRATFDDGFRDNYGMAWDYETSAKARAVALADCREVADVARYCRVVATFRGQCASVAYAIEDEYGMGWAVANNSQTAERRALAKCREDAVDPDRCRIEFTHCDSQ